MAFLTDLCMACSEYTPKQQWVEKLRLESLLLDMNHDKKDALNAAS